MSRKSSSPGVILSQLPESLRPSIKPILEHVLCGASGYVDLSRVNSFVDADVARAVMELKSAGLIVMRHDMSYKDEAPVLLGLYIALK